MKLKSKFTGLLKLVFPSAWPELLLFLFFVLGYGILGSYIAYHYRIIFDNRIPWDAYFSFDNRAIVMTGGGFERHPLSNYFFDQLRWVASWVSDVQYDWRFRMVLAWFSIVTVSLNLVQVYKYLRNIIELPVFLAVTIVLFFSFFSTNILLSFTPETYTYTLFLLVLFQYYSALMLKRDRKIPATALTLAGVTIGGLTITNIVKVYIPLLFERKLFWNWKKIVHVVIRVVLSVAVFLLLYLNRMNFELGRIFSKTEQQYEKFSNPKVTPLWDMICSWFLGGNMLFPGFVLRDYHNKKGFEYKALFMDTYSSAFSYVFVGLIVVLMLWSYVKNFRNRWVQMVMISFFVDVLIHCVLKFGLHTSYIYGGHFIFVVPLMLGWLFYAYRNSTKMISIFYGILLIVMIYLLLNNIFRMQEFFIFLESFYR